jgi:hypothetical protein
LGKEADTHGRVYKNARRETEWQHNASRSQARDDLSIPLVLILSIGDHLHDLPAYRAIIAGKIVDSLIKPKCIAPSVGSHKQQARSGVADQRCGTVGMPQVSTTLFAIATVVLFAAN